MVCISFSVSAAENAGVELVQKKSGLTALLDGTSHNKRYRQIDFSAVALKEISKFEYAEIARRYHTESFAISKA